MFILFSQPDERCLHMSTPSPYESNIRLQMNRNNFIADCKRQCFRVFYVICLMQILYCSVHYYYYFFRSVGLFAVPYRFRRSASSPKYKMRLGLFVSSHSFFRIYTLCLQFENPTVCWHTSTSQPSDEHFPISN